MNQIEEEGENQENDSQDISKSNFSLDKTESSNDYIQM